LTFPVKNLSASPSILGKRKEQDASSKTVTWEEGKRLVGAVEVPSRKELDTAEIWYDQKRLGLVPLLERNDSEEIEELSRSLSDSPGLSDEKKKEYSYEQLKEKADNLAKIRSLKITKTQSSFDLSQLENDSDSDEVIIIYEDGEEDFF
jgi:hypothetical protein